jgi:hypothetical protein
MINDELKKNPVPGTKGGKEPYLPMRRIHRKLVVDDKGMPTEVIIPWKEYQQIEELLGLDLDAAACDDLKKARQDREAKNNTAFVDLDSI